MHEQFAHVAVSSLVDTEKPLLSAGRVFSRHEAEPRGQIAGFVELSTVSNGSKECSRPQSSDPRDRHETSCDIFAICYRLDLACEVTNAVFQLAQVGEQVCEQLTHRRRKIV